MRKIKTLIKNMYRIIVVKPDGQEKVYKLSESEHTVAGNAKFDCLLKEIISGDELNFDADVEIQKNLEQRVAGKGRPSVLAKNSFAEAILPVFSIRHLEMKMALVTLAVVFMLGIGPTGNHTVNRSLTPMILADTLIDSSVLHISTLHNSSPDTGIRF